MHDFVTALWLAMQDETPLTEPDDDDDDDDDEGGGGLAVPPAPPPPPGRWPPRVRLFLPRKWEPVPVAVGAEVCLTCLC